MMKTLYFMLSSVMNNFVNLLMVESQVDLDSGQNEEGK